MDSRYEHLQKAILPPPEKAAFFFDFDGTLVELASSPESIRVAPDLLPLLSKLQKQLKGAVAVISGRRVSSLKKFLKADLIMGGLHGAELYYKGKIYHHKAWPHQDEAVREKFFAAKAFIKAQTQTFQGFVLEDKGWSLALHYRKNPRLKSAAKQILYQALETYIPLSRGYTIQRGHAVLELIPKGVTKGNALKYLMHRPPFLGRYPIAFGDDITDESMFSAAESFLGSSLYIGKDKKRTRAVQSLHSPSLLRKTLWSYGV